MKKAIYPWSFDPLTKWHEDIIKRAWEKFEWLIIWVWQNAAKKYMFSFPERVRMIEWSVKKRIEEAVDTNIEVIPYSWLLVDFAFESWVRTIVRWIRWSEDLGPESLLHWAGESQKLWIDTVLLLSKQDQTHVSSSVTKAMLKEQWLIHDYVSLNVKHFLEARMMWQYMVGLTGTIWAGKSYITERFEKLWKEYNIEVHNIDLDKIWHRILEIATEEGYKQVRHQLVDEFWLSIRKDDWFINRKVLGAIVFDNAEKRRRLDEILYNSIILRIRKEMTGKKWIILLNWALIAESWITNLTNNNVVLIWVSPQIQQERLASRWLDGQQIHTRVNSQFSTQAKEEVIQKSIREKWHWEITSLENNWGNDIEIRQAFFKMVSSVDLFAELRIKSVLSKIGHWEKWLELYGKIKPLHDSPERAHHSWFHIVDCINKLYEIKSQISNEEFVSIFLAFLFHDSVYDPKSHWWQNEKNSAILAEKIMTELWITNINIEQIKELIELTAKHLVEWNNSIGKYMVDIDLSILWESWNKYDTYKNAIRREYSCYSDKEYKAGRIQFLEWMIMKRPIFQTKYFYEKYENLARCNMAKELLMLKWEKVVAM